MSRLIPNPTDIFRKVDGTVADVELLLGRVDATLSSVDRTLSSVDGKLSSVDTTLAASERTLAQVEATLTDTTALLGEVRDLLTGFLQQLAVLERVPMIETEVTAIRELLAHVSAVVVGVPE
jgi:ABC-type transporter Mla subunit MlaD